MRREFSGRVFTGAGEASLFTDLDWFKKFVLNQFSFDVYRGTLNLRAQRKTDVAVLESLREPGVGYMLKSPDPKYCNAKLFSARIPGNVKVAVVLPEIAQYPKDVCEIVSNVNLRKTLLLTDGQLVQATIEVR